MQLMLRRDQPLDRLAGRIACADTPGSDLLHDVAATCERFATLKQAGKTESFDAFCKSGAWIDAALALLAHELPGWSIRRLVQDSGLWFCALSPAPKLPTELDEMVEASHEDMALAILFAFVEARRTGKVAAAAAGSVPATGVTAGYRICCDNFL